MSMHFTRAEFAARRKVTIAALEARGLSGLLMFRQESMYYLSGYDTFGYVFFQCYYLGADGRQFLLTRAPDLRQAQLTSDIVDIRVWVDGPKSNPSAELRDMLKAWGLAGKKLGIEWDAYGLTAKNGMQVAAAFEGFATLVDASDTVSKQRLMKSASEIAYVEKAAHLADLALDEAHRLTAPGVSGAEILAAMQSIIIRNDGDDPANEFIIGSGPEALLCRYHSGRRTLAQNDQLTLEFAGVFRHYHSALMRTIPIGQVPPRQIEMHKVAIDALEACKAALIPGRPIGEVFDAHAKVLDAAGYNAYRMNATGYSLGTTFAPNWMDYPMFYHGNSEVAAPNQVFFIHLIIFDSERGLAMTSGQTVVVTETGCRVLSKRGTELVTR